MCLATNNNLLLMLQNAPKNIFSPTNSQSSGQPKNSVKTLIFFTLDNLSPVFFLQTQQLLLCNSRFNFHCCTQCKPTPTQKLARKCHKWQLQPFMTSCMKDYKGHLLVQTSFMELPNRTFLPVLFCSDFADLVLFMITIHSLIEL